MTTINFHALNALLIASRLLMSYCLETLDDAEQAILNTRAALRHFRRDVDAATKPQPLKGGNGNGTPNAS